MPERSAAGPAATPTAAEPAGAAAWLLRIVDLVSKACGMVAASLIFSAVLITCQMIWVRFVLNGSTYWQTEAVTYLMIAATTLGLPYVQLLRGHVNVDLLPMLLPRSLGKALALFTLGLTLAVVAAMTFHGFELFHLALDRNWKSDTVWGVPLWIPYLAIPLGFGLFFVQLSADLYRAWIDSPGRTGNDG